jgi:molybdopterin-guanine dinucleotide biosynthesis protein MobB
MHVFGITGWKNSGKTTLVVKLVSHLAALGYKVSTIKHAHHAFDIDQPGRDSFQHREAGATEVLVSSVNRWALIHELRNENEISLNDVLSKLTPVDLVLIEGYKHDEHPKLQVYRPDVNKEVMLGNIPNIVAIASNQPLQSTVPVLNLNNIEEVADFILRFFSMK